MDNETRIPGFCLLPYDAAQLTELLNHYGPYSNGQTAVFWHITGIIGQHRKPRDLETEDCSALPQTANHPE
jgi:ABC-type lipopolysaccharide export system ATPase subunit